MGWSKTKKGNTQKDSHIVEENDATSMPEDFQDLLLDRFFFSCKKVAAAAWFFNK